MARRVDGRWSTKLLGWRPEGSRAVGHPVKRWADSIKDFFKQAGDMQLDWRSVAKEKETWSYLEGEYIDYCAQVGTEIF